jgi:hypothetical protein
MRFVHSSDKTAVGRDAIYSLCDDHVDWAGFGGRGVGPPRGCQTTGLRGLLSKDNCEQSKRLTNVCEAVLTERLL